MLALSRKRRRWLQSCRTWWWSRGSLSRTLTSPWSGSSPPGLNSRCPNTASQSRPGSLEGQLMELESEQALVPKPKTALELESEQALAPKPREPCRSSSSCMTERHRCKKILGKDKFQDRSCSKRCPEPPRQATHAQAGPGRRPSALTAWTWTWRSQRQRRWLGDEQQRGYTSAFGMGCKMQNNKPRKNVTELCMKQAVVCWFVSEKQASRQTDKQNNVASKELNAKPKHEAKGKDRQTNKQTEQWNNASPKQGKICKTSAIATRRLHES